MKNRAYIAILSTFMITGCAVSPKKPPTCKGELQPINTHMITQKQFKKGQKQQCRSRDNAKIN